MPHPGSVESSLFSVVSVCFSVSMSVYVYLSTYKTITRHIRDRHFMCVDGEQARFGFGTRPRRTVIYVVLRRCGVDQTFTVSVESLLLLAMTTDRRRHDVGKAFSDVDVLDDDRFTIGV